MPLKLLIFGRTGQVATEIRRRAGPLLEVTSLGRAEANLTVPGQCSKALRRISASGEVDAVINAAAYTAVDTAESEAEIAHAVNTAAPGEIATVCAELGLPLIHISTDYVFDGNADRPWREADPTAPLGVYGQTKLAGEEAIRASGCRHAILRTAWVFSAHGSNFVRTMVRVGKNGPLRVVADQIGGPTHAADIAAALVSIAEAFRIGRGVDGVFHFCGAPTTSWHGLAKEVFERVDWPERPRVEAISTADWPTPARRPANSALECTLIEESYGVAQPDWRTGLDAVLRELGEIGG